MCNQMVIDEAVRIATRAALMRNPVRSIVWVPPQLATEDPRGLFAVEYYTGRTGSETEPWEG